MSESDRAPQRESTVAQALKMMRLIGLSPADFRTTTIVGLGATLTRLLTLMLLLPLVFALMGGNVGRLDRLMQLSEVFDTSDPQRLVWTLGAAILLSGLLSAGLSYLGSVLTVRTGERTRLRLSGKLMRAYFSYGQQYFDRVRFARVVTKTSRLPSLGPTYYQFLSNLLVASLAFSIYVIVMAVLSPLLTIIVLIALLAYLYGFNHLTRRIEESDARIKNSEEDVSGIASEYIVNLPLLRLFNAEDKALSAHNRAQRQAHDVRVEGNRAEAVIDPLRELTTVALLVAFVVVAAGLDGGINKYAVSTYFVFFLVLRQAMGRFSLLLSAPRRWRKIRMRFIQLFDLLDTDDKYVIPGGTETYTGLGEGVAIRDLEFSYRGKSPVLKGLSLNIPGGRRTVIVGSTGSGKSTLIRLLLRRYDCPPGSIFIGGTDLRQMDTRQWLGHVAYADAHPMFFNDTVRNNLAIGRDYEDSALRAAAEKSMALDFISQLPDGWNQMVGDRGTLMSTGEQQRLALARIFLGDPDLILLDEATSALDPATEKQVMSAIDEFAAGKTIVLITHRLAALRGTDHIIVVQDGRAVESGTRDELIAADGEFARLWSISHDEG